MLSQRNIMSIKGSKNSNSMSSSCMLSLSSSVCLASRMDLKMDACSFSSETETEAPVFAVSNGRMNETNTYHLNVDAVIAQAISVGVLSALVEKELVDYSVSKNSRYLMTGRFYGRRDMAEFKMEIYQHHYQMPTLPVTDIKESVLVVSRMSGDCFVFGRFLDELLGYLNNENVLSDDEDDDDEVVVLPMLPALTMDDMDDDDEDDKVDVGTKVDDLLDGLVGDDIEYEDYRFASVMLLSYLKQSESAVRYISDMVVSDDDDSSDILHKLITNVTKHKIHDTFLIKNLLEVILLVVKDMTASKQKDKNRLGGSLNLFDVKTEIKKLKTLWSKEEGVKLPFARGLHHIFHKSQQINKRCHDVLFAISRFN